MRVLRFPLFLLLLLSLPLAARAQREKFTPDELDTIEQTWPNARKTNTGIRYVIERAGKGLPPAPGDEAAVYYVGSLLNGGKVFDRHAGNSPPFVFRVGREKVIAGWDQVLQLMKPGEKRLVIIPAELAYGTVGSAPDIPRNASLVFEIELVSVKRESGS